MKSTVVSLCPFPILARKDTIYPVQNFIVPKMIAGVPGLLHVDDGHRFVYLDEDRGNIKVPVMSAEIAAAIVNDYCGSQLYTSLPNIAPGIFYIAGEVNFDQIKTLHKDKLEAAVIRHKAWLEVLVRKADESWSKVRNHALITDIQRLAAKVIGVSPEWMEITIAQTSKRCPACTETVKDEAVICPHCKFILNAEKYKTMTFAK